MNCFSGDIDGYNVQLSDTWTIIHLVNEVRMATPTGNCSCRKAGFNAATPWIAIFEANIFPTFNLTGTVAHR